MSLAITFHVTVRQKGRFGDSYIGYIPINPGSFKIDPGQVTHWYKLGPKPGKPSTKLRGDLQVTFQFLSKWSGGGAVAAAEDLSAIPGHVGMIKHSSSDMRISATMRHTNSDEALSSGRGGVAVKNKREILSSLRRSFRRKTKTPAMQASTDDFVTFSSHSASSTPQNARKRNSSSMVGDNASNSLSSTSYLSNGQSDSDTGNSIISQSPPPVSKGLRTSESEDGLLTAADREKESTTETGTAVSAQDGKLVRENMASFLSKHLL